MLITNFEGQAHKVDAFVDLKSMRIKMVEAGKFYNPQDQTNYINVYKPTSAFEQLVEKLTKSNILKTTDL